MYCPPPFLSSGMFGIRHDIKRIYQECVGNPAFRINFERKIGTLVKTRAARGTIDYNKLMTELRIIARSCKERGYGARRYLEILAGFVQDATLGHHRSMHLDKEKLQLKPLKIHRVNTTDSSIHFKNF